MATGLSPEESARKILAIFASKNIRAGQILTAGQVNLQFLTTGGGAEEYAAGAEYALAHGWLEQSSTFKLTEAGFDEM